jgi:enterochelin esterase-like enzyme
MTSGKRNIADGHAFYPRHPKEHTAMNAVARVITLVAVIRIAFPGVAAATTTTVTRFSPSNGRNLSFVVYAPPGYQASGSQSYPVVYSLHGIGGTAPNRANQLVPTLDAAIVAGDVPPMIWVFPDGQTDSFYGDAFDGSKRVYSNIIGEVIPYVDANYRTVAAREGRAMEGFSMGGFGAAMYAAKHPELFSAVAESGGALSDWPTLTQFNAAVAENMYDTVEANWLPYSLWDLSAQNAAALAQLNYLMVVGDADPLEQGNIRFRNHLNSLGVFPEFHILPGIPHAGGAYFNEGTVLQFLGDHFAATVPEPGSALTLLAIICLGGRRGRRNTAGGETR